MKKIELYLVHGALGSGKTTFIQELSKDTHFAHSYIIENEFANYSVDTEVLRHSFHNHDIIDISGGCICCSSGEELSDALDLIAEKNIHKHPVIIETTGAVYSVQLLKKLLLSATFTSNFELRQNIFIIELQEHTAKSLENSILDIMLADVIVLNKLKGTSQENIKEIMEFISTVNTGCRVIQFDTTSTLDTEAIRSIHSHTETVLLEHFEEISRLKEERHEDELRYHVIKMDHDINAATLEKRIQELFTTHDLLRVKGFFRAPDDKVYHLEATRQEVKIELMEGLSGDLKMVLIGKDSTITNIQL